MSEIENIALFDLDGTLADYDSAMERDYTKLMTSWEKKNGLFVRSFVKDRWPNYAKNRIDIIRNQPGWWENLKELKIGFDVFYQTNELGFTPYILTKGPKSSPNAYTEKKNWVEKHVRKKNSETKIILTEDKGVVYGKVLIDDWPEYIERWLENRERGLVIMPAHRWNENFQHQNVIRYDGTNLETVRKALIIARDRKYKEELNLSKL